MASKKITLTDDQRKYVKANYKKESAYQMGRVLGISQTKISRNMFVMKLTTPFVGREKFQREKVKEGFFDIDRMPAFY